jgi:hypothetical protein
MGGRRTVLLVAVLGAAVVSVFVFAGTAASKKPDLLAQVPPYVPDHYTCYGVSQIGPTAKISVLLTTQFDAAPVSALTVRTLSLCAPTSKNGGRISDPADHLDCRQIAVPGSFIARNVLVTNQFGSIVLRVFAPWSLCAPALKSLTGVFPAPPAVRPDHFECYVARFEGNFMQRTVTISNQFETTTTVTIRKPVQLCAPVEKTVGQTTFPITHPTVHLVCYELMPRLGAVGPFTVFTSPQFGIHQLVVRQRDTLCLPSTKTLL